MHSRPPRFSGTAIPNIRRHPEHRPEDNLYRGFSEEHEFERNGNMLLEKKYAIKTKSHHRGGVTGHFVIAIIIIIVSSVAGRSQRWLQMPPADDRNSDDDDNYARPNVVNRSHCSCNGCSWSRRRRSIADAERMQPLVASAAVYLVSVCGRMNYTRLSSSHQLSDTFTDTCPQEMWILLNLLHVRPSTHSSPKTLHQPPVPN